MLDSIEKIIDVPCDAKHAFNVFVDKVDSWWPKDKNSVSAMQGQVAKKIVIEPRQGGRVYEIDHEDKEQLWGSVSVFQPGQQLTLEWHIGLTAEKASMVNVQFDEIDGKHTTVKLTHSRWEAFAEKAEDMRNGYNQGWVGVFEQAYKNAC